MKQLTIILLFFLVYPSCTDDKTTGPKKDQGIDWPNRADKEDCIEILKMTYEHRDIDKYQEIILQPDPESDYFPEGYIWYNHPGDTLEYGVFYDFEQDWKATLGIFEESRELFLGITEGEWTELHEFRGKPCSNCWGTTRSYVVEMFRELGEMNFYASSKVRFVIGPARHLPYKYLIYEATDWDYSNSLYQDGIHGNNLSTSASAITWSELKGIFMPE
jgi:hypothetical protein